MKKLHDLYKILQMAETKDGYNRYGYEEYIHGMYSVNDLCSAFMELYEMHKSCLKDLEMSNR